MSHEGIPPWFTNELVKFALEKSEQSEVIIEDLHVDYAIPKGTNVISTLLRTKIVYRVNGKEKLHTKSLVLKKLKHVEGEAGEQFNKIGFMEKEYRVYKELMPKVVDVLKEDLTPKIYPSPEEEVLIMEDLNADGYKMCKKSEQLNFEECAQVLISVAKFHASSLKIMEENPDIIRELGEDVVYEGGVSEKIMKPMWNQAMKQVKTWPEFKDYHKCFDYLTENVFNKISKAMKHKEGPLYVLNHGDLHLLNMMFKRDQGKVSAKLIDFQGTIYNSPAFDICEFLTISPKEEVRDNRIDELLDIYLETLNGTLMKIGSNERLEKQELVKSMNDLMILDFFMSFVALAFLVCDEELVAEKMFSEERNPMIESFKSSFYKERLSKRLYEHAKIGTIWKDNEKMSQEGIPSWFRNELVKFALEKSEQSEIIIEDLHVENAIPKGTNVISTLLRTKIVYRVNGKEKLHTKSLVLKKLKHIEGEAGEQFNKVGFMEKEYRVYKELMPKVFDVLKEDLTPKNYPTPVEEVLIMEDLNADGYKMCKKSEQLNFEECAQVFKSVAKFHASSLKIMEENPDFIRDIGEGNVFEAAEMIMKPMWSQAMKQVKTWPEFKDYHKCFDYLTENIVNKVREAMKLKEGPLYVLNHGDLHLLNMMFKRDQGKVSAKLIDFQGTIYNSPAYDIRAFLTISPKEEVRDNRIEELLDIYLETLNGTLMKIGCKERLEKQELVKSMNDLMIFDLFISIIALAFLVCNEQIAAEQMFSEDSNPMFECFKSSFYRERLSKRLNEHAKIGTIWKDNEK